MISLYSIRNTSGNQPNNVKKPLNTGRVYFKSCNSPFTVIAYRASDIAKFRGHSHWIEISRAEYLALDEIAS
jgi:hypothetical protein